MTAAQTIKTPVMVLPPRRGSPDPLADMQVLARRLRRISLGEIVAGGYRGVTRASASGCASCHPTCPLVHIMSPCKSKLFHIETHSIT